MGIDEKLALLKYKDTVKIRMPMGFKNTLQTEPDQPFFIQRVGGENGYTIIEFVIVLVVVSIVGAAAAGLYLYTTKWIKHWEANIAAENNGHLLMSQVSRDLRHAHSFEVIGDSVWTIQYPGKNEIRYRYKDSSIYRNGWVIGGNHMPVQHFSARLDSSLFYEEGALLKGSGVRIVTIILQLGLERSKISLRSKIRMRQQKPWPRHVLYLDSTDISTETSDANSSIKDFQ